VSSQVTGLPLFSVLFSYRIHGMPISRVLSQHFDTICNMTAGIVWPEYGWTLYKCGSAPLNLNINP